MSEAIPLHSPSSRFRKIFFQERQIRAGWRLLIFLLVLVLAAAGAMLIVRRVRPGIFSISVLSPGIVLVLASVRFAATLFATCVSGRIEHRKLGSFGLPLTSGFLRDMALGAIWGLMAISLLLTIIGLKHGFHINSLAEHGWRALFYAVVWGLAFILVGLAEEFTFRGYAQYTLADGIGFWPAAVLLSLAFAGVHYANSGESLFGLLEVVLIALFFCLTLWQTGALWFAVGYHAAWDWAETCLYGTSDSGAPGTHHLLNSSFSGPHWLTGGPVGPEGSALNIPLNLLVAVLFLYAFRKRSEPESPW
jgi:membrane protease YdiL (CAAX protease family)